MRRRGVLATLAAIAAGSRSGQGQPAAEKPRRIAILSPGADPQRPIFVAFREALRELGHVEGHSVVIELHLASGRAGVLATLARQAVGGGVDLIITDGRLASEAALAATTTIPIVAVIGGDPVELGMVQSLARPGGNLTGVTMFSVESAEKQVELLVESVPGVRRVIVLHGSPASAFQQRAVTAADRIGLEARLVRVTSEDEVEKAVDSTALPDTDGVIVTADPVTAGLRHTVVAHLNARRLPAVYMEREYAEAGGLMSYGVSVPGVFRQLAGYVDQILHGARPADLPIQRPNRLEFVINLRTARTLGLTIPPLVLARADEVIE
jgi:putative ABC transport system substrate-binding protein